MPVLNPSSNYKTLVGTVVNAGQRARTIRVRVDEMRWNKKVQKYYLEPYHVLVRDTNRSCEIGDVINVRSNWRVSKHVRHVLTKIITPFGTPLSKRPPVPTIQELQQEYETYRFAKDLRQAARGREASAARLLEYPASEIYESLLGINAIQRRKLIAAWKQTIYHYPESTDAVLQEIVTPSVGDPQLKAEVRALLKEMKPHIKQVVEDAVDETPTQRKEPINDRLGRQSGNLACLHKLHGLVKRVRKVLEPNTSSSSHPTSILDNNLTRIREAFRESVASGKVAELKSLEPLA